jgi:hypothetical protein
MRGRFMPDSTAEEWCERRLGSRIFAHCGRLKTTPALVVPPPYNERKWSRDEVSAPIRLR